MNSTQNDDNMNNIKTINNNKMRKAKSKVNIVVKKNKQPPIIKFTIHLSENGTLTMSKKINKIFILVSSQLNV